MEWQGLSQLLILLGAALLLGTVAEQFRQSAIVGYLLAGTIIGPHGWGLVRENETVELIAELGIALLLFTIGLEFSLRKLRGLGGRVLAAGVLQIAVTWLLAGLVAAWLGASAGTAITVGAMVSLSSTAIVLRLLTERAEMEAPHGRNAIGILLAQDVAVLPMTLVVSALVGGSGAGEAMWRLGKTLLFGALLVAAFLLLFNVVVPRLLNIRRWAANREFPILLAIIIGIGSASAAHAVGASHAIGAFLAGVLLAESPFATQIRADVVPLRTLMLTVFFASIGMISDPMWALQNAGVVVIAAMAVIGGSTAIVFGLLVLLRNPVGIALATALCLAQVGEFSFVLAQMGRDAPPGRTPLISPHLFNLSVAVTVITLFITPYLVQVAPKAAEWVEGIRARRRGRRPAEELVEQQREKGTSERAADAIKAHEHGVGADSEGQPTPVAKHADRGLVIIVGFGPAGQRVAENLLEKYAPRLRVIDLNPRSCAVAQRYGLAMHLGNAAQPEVLEEAGIHRARAVVVTLPDPATTSKVIHLCRHLNPNAHLLVRARYHAFRWELQMAGAETVIDEEEHVGRRLAAEVQRVLRIRD